MFKRVGMPDGSWLHVGAEVYWQTETDDADGRAALVYDPAVVVEITSDLEAIILTRGRELSVDRSDLYTWVD